jgi:hypothetical protein
MERGHPDMSDAFHILDDADRVVGEIETAERMLRDKTGGFECIKLEGTVAKYRFIKLGYSQRLRFAQIPNRYRRDKPESELKPWLQWFAGSTNKRKEEAANAERSWNIRTCPTVVVMQVGLIDDIKLGPGGRLGVGFRIGVGSIAETACNGLRLTKRRLYLV